MAYPFQACLWWGKDLTLIYNAPYSEVCPLCLKSDYLDNCRLYSNTQISLECWDRWPGLVSRICFAIPLTSLMVIAELWNSLGPLSELVLSGTPVSKEDGRFDPYARNVNLTHGRFPPFQAITAPRKRHL